jgi:hypothetical protein
MYKKKYFILLTFLLFLLSIELFSTILIKLKLLPKFLPPVITLHAHKEYSYWHPINQKLKISTLCWESEVEFNSLGIKSISEFSIKKIKPRIGIIGDSMTENIQLNNNQDFTYKLQNKLKNFEIINFSVASTGLADQINIYESLMTKFDLDYIFLFITENDFEDNHINSRRPNRIAYKIDDGNIVKIDRDKKFFEDYFSKFNIFKRKYSIYFKELNSYNLFFYLKEKTPLIITNNKDGALYNNNDYAKNFEEKKIIYRYLSQELLRKIKNNQKLLVFFNINNNSFMLETEERKTMKKIWEPTVVYDPKNESINFLKKINKLYFPFMGYTCDTHYSEVGAEFLSNYVAQEFLKLKN